MHSCSALIVNRQPKSRHQTIGYKILTYCIKKCLVVTCVYKNGMKVHTGDNCQHWRQSHNGIPNNCWSGSIYLHTDSLSGLEYKIYFILISLHFQETYIEP